ncbi:MAG: ZIP family metal transporter [Pyramidobacter sp.]
MNAEVLIGFLIPFVGTSAGAALVFFMTKSLNRQVSRALTGFAAGVMTAASVWSLLIPAMEQSSSLGRWAFVPAVSGFWAGVFFLLVLDHVIPHLHMYSDTPEGCRSELTRTTMLVLAVTLHNIPEGMAVGAVYAGLTSPSSGVSSSAALALSLGIAIQNLPEGAIVSMPLRSQGFSSRRAFANGVLSGAVEPLGALLTFWAASVVVPVLPYFLAFAAGAMVYVVVEELIPEMSSGEHSHAGVLSYMLGFTVMMVLDVFFG